MVLLLMIIVNNIVIVVYVYRTTARGRRYMVSNTLSETQKNRIRAVATQALLYVDAFFLTLLWVVVIKIIGDEGFTQENESQFYWLFVCQAVFSPLTGFFNLIIFVRPRYIQFRHDNPSMSRWWALKRGLSGDKPKRETNTAVQNQKSTPASGNRIEGAASNRACWRWNRCFRRDPNDGTNGVETYAQRPAVDTGIADQRESSTDQSSQRNVQQYDSWLISAPRQMRTSVSTPSDVDDALPRLDEEQSQVLKEDNDGNGNSNDTSEEVHHLAVDIGVNEAGSNISDTGPD